MTASRTTPDGPLCDGAARFSWRLAPGRLFEPARPALLAILNVTPDSFSDGGELPTPQAVAARARDLAEQGADALDIGGESTRPGAEPVSEREQIGRVLPAIAAVRDAGITLPITVDTTRAAVAEAALDAGADAINDVSGGTDDPDLLPLAARRGVGVILMHRLRAPARDAYSTAYAREPVYEGGVIRAVRWALEERVRAARDAGVDGRAIIVDPGVGFGKSVEQNRELIREVRRFHGLGAGVLIGASRKSFLTAGREIPPGRRDPESVGAALAAHVAGAHILRVHDLKWHRRSLDAAAAILGNTH